MSVTLRMANQFHAALQAALRAGVQITWPSPKVEERDGNEGRGWMERAVLAMPNTFTRRDVPGMPPDQAGAALCRMARRGFVRIMSPSFGGAKPAVWQVTAAGRKHLAKVHGGKR